MTVPKMRTLTCTTINKKKKNTIRNNIRNNQEITPIEIKYENKSSKYLAHIYSRAEYLTGRKSDDIQTTI